MRCQLCDFGPGESLYSQGLGEKHSQENKVVFNEDHRIFICLDCQDEMWYTTLEADVAECEFVLLEEQETEEVDIGNPSPVEDN